MNTNENPPRPSLIAPVTLTCVAFVVVLANGIATSMSEESRLVVAVIAVILPACFVFVLLTLWVLKPRQSPPPYYDIIEPRPYQPRVPKVNYLPAPSYDDDVPYPTSRRGLRYEAHVINHPTRPRPPAPTPDTITTAGITVEVERLQKMICAPAPTRKLVQATEAGISNNIFGDYISFLELHNLVERVGVSARWAHNYQSQPQRERWLNAILNHSPTTADICAEDD
jgi:hypothetical protein